MKIGIIGSSGKLGEIRKVHLQTYNNMLNVALADIKYFESINLIKHSPKSTILISGGAALSDHIAVDLFLKGEVNRLMLYLPCKWDEKKCQFIDLGEDDWIKNPGKLANQRHRSFSKQLHRNTLHDIQMAIDKGATVIIGEGFHKRNLELAKDAQALIAFTFTSEMSSGTKFTWNASKLDSQLKRHHLIN